MSKEKEFNSGFKTAEPEEEEALTALRDIHENTHELLLSDSRGVYIPANAVDMFSWISEGLDEWTLEQLTGEDPQNRPTYWEAWDTALNTTYEYDGDRIELDQHGDLFAIYTDKRDNLEKVWEAKYKHLDTDSIREQAYDY